MTKEYTIKDVTEIQLSEHPNSSEVLISFHLRDKHAEHPTLNIDILNVDLEAISKKFSLKVKNLSINSIFDNDVPWHIITLEFTVDNNDHETVLSMMSECQKIRASRDH